jgi:hypothetical protein
MENGMICRVDTLREAVVLVGHHPISVFTTTAEHIDRIHRTPDGHYDREDVMTLVKDGYAAPDDERPVHSIAQAAEILTFGCPPAR